MENFLKYGFIGLGLAMFILIARGFLQVYNKDQISRNHIYLYTIFLAFASLIIFLGYSLESASKTTTAGVGGEQDSTAFANDIKTFLGDEAYDSHSSAGGDAKKIGGDWTANYYLINENDPMSINNLTDTLSQVMLATHFTKLPSEDITLTTDKSIIYAQSKGEYRSKDQFRLWGRGRLSVGDDIIFNYWSNNHHQQDQITGVNFLHFRPNLRTGGSDYMFGWWAGRIADGSASYGYTVWTKSNY